MPVRNSKSAAGENNVMREFVLRNEVYFVTQVIGIVCAR